MTNGKVYCKGCVYYIAHSPSLQNTAEEEDGRDVCGKTMTTYTDQVGREVLKRYGEHDECKKCGHSFYDTRTIIYTKCFIKNKDYDCVDFKAFTFQDKVKNYINTKIRKNK